jgi:hypothetical protein
MFDQAATQHRSITINKTKILINNLSAFGDKKQEV